MGTHRNPPAAVADIPRHKPMKTEQHNPAWNVGQWRDIPYRLTMNPDDNASLESVNWPKTATSRVSRHLIGSRTVANRKDRIAYSDVGIYESARLDAILSFAGVHCSGIIVCGEERYMLARPAGIGAAKSSAACETTARSWAVARLPGADSELEYV